jgi:hypothetical protein
MSLVVFCYCILPNQLQVSASDNLDPTRSDWVKGEISLFKSWFKENNMNVDKNLQDYVSAKVSEEEKAEFRLIFCKAAAYYYAKANVPQFKGNMEQFAYTYSQGLKYKKEGLYNGALRVFILLQEENPFFWGLYRNVGIILGMQGEDEAHAIRLTRH